MNNALPKSVIPKALSHAFISTFLLLQGCCTTPPAGPHTYHRPPTEVQKLEVKIVDLMQGLEIARRSQNHLLDPALGPVPEASFDKARQARESVFSDEDYLQSTVFFRRSAISQVEGSRSRGGYLPSLADG